MVYIVNGHRFTDSAAAKAYAERAARLGYQITVSILVDERQPKRGLTVEIPIQRSGLEG